MASSLPNQEAHQPLPSFSEIRELTQRRFAIQPCLWQLKVAHALLRGRDVVCTAGTGMGKTLTFWIPRIVTIPLLFCTGGIQIVVTPLNLLRKQNAQALAKAAIRAIAINSETASDKNIAAIREFQYHAVIISPEQVMKPDSGFEKLLKDPLFSSRIISIIIDEAHCICDWGDFRPEYKELGRLHYILPTTVPILIASATLTKDALSTISQLLHMHADNIESIWRSSNRPNIKIGVKKIRYSLDSYADLGFLIPDGWKDRDSPPPKFLVFFDNIQQSIQAAMFLCHRLPHQLQDKVKWFNANMTTTYKEKEFENLQNGETWGYCTTESFGMGMDVSDIELVVQWRATCKLSTLWQRFGHTVRNKELSGTAILFAEKDYVDDEQAAKEARREQRKRKAKISWVDAMAEALKSKQQTERREKRRRKDVDVGMDYLINAETRMGLLCRRKVFDVYFDNAESGERSTFRYDQHAVSLMLASLPLDSDHVECNTNDPKGCTLSYL
ncbi:P-loop containing nucleoside triphosphate hydrolase protein [Tylopilus felleus]